MTKPKKGDPVEAPKRKTMRRKPWRIVCLTGDDAKAMRAAVELRAALILINAYWSPTILGKRLGFKTRSRIHAHAKALLRSMSDQQIASHIKALPEIIKEVEYWMTRLDCRD